MTKIWMPSDKRDHGPRQGAPCAPASRRPGSVELVGDAEHGAVGANVHRVGRHVGLEAIDLEEPEVRIGSAGAAGAAARVPETRLAVIRIAVFGAHDPVGP